MKLLVFAGAGSSVELGVPAMAGLARAFQAHCEQWKVEPDLVRQMMGDNDDVEFLIEGLDKIDDARDAITNLGTTLPLDRVHTVRSEVEWFVQHAAEKVSANDARLMWGSILRATHSHRLTFVTTNYDRAIELAANAEGVRLDDGFEAFSDNEAVRWIGFDTENNVCPIVKLHGSTDWYSDLESGDPRKLRHPMPLFGRGTLSLANGEELGSAMVLPSREKLLNRAPYPRMSQAFLNAVDQCEIAVFVGSSIRDQHVREQARTIARDRPVFVINRSGTVQGIENAHAIAQPASQFLISTLPAALSSPDPLTVLSNSRRSGEESLNVLQLLQIGTDIREQTDRRCNAIEELDTASLPLDELIVGNLLADQDATVSRFALGLVATSSACSNLLSCARKSPHKNDSAFAEELEILEKLICAEG
jgi:hypothetical protein